MNALSIRWRLTLWYGGVLAAILVAFSVSVYFLMRHGLLQRTDSVIIGQLNKTIADVEAAENTEDLVRRLSGRARGHKEYEYQVSRLKDGELLFRSERLGEEALPIPVGEDSNRYYHDTAELDRAGPLRVVGRVAEGPTGPVFVQTTLSLDLDRHELAELLRVLFLAGPLALIVTIAGGYLLARRALAPVERMTTAANEITASRLDRRLSVTNAGDELGRLAQTLNGMIGRLEQSFHETKQFTADAAHELRTPLAVMRNEAEVALQTVRTPDEYRRVLENILEEVERLTRLAGQLLYLAREDSRVQVPERREVRLDQLVTDVAEHMRVLAAAKEIDLRVEGLGPCRVHGDPDRLRRVLFNLLDNACKYTPRGGTVTVSCSNLSGSAELVVEDSGIGIQKEYLPHVFNRFFRADASRTANGAGVGLGLAITRSIVESHGGAIQVESDPDKGTRFTIHLPATVNGV